jgi:glycine betaine catabolism A
MSSRGYAHGGVLVPGGHDLGDFHAWLCDRLGEGST